MIIEKDSILYNLAKGLARKDLLHISRLRNTVQHIDERIDDCLLDFDMPFYGVISWEINLGTENTMHKFFAISGLYIPNGKLQYKIKKKNLSINEFEKKTEKVLINQDVIKVDWVKKERHRFKIRFLISPAHNIL